MVKFCLYFILVSVSAILRSECAPVKREVIVDGRGFYLGGGANNNIREASQMFDLGGPIANPWINAYTQPLHRSGVLPLPAPISSGHGGQNTHQQNAQGGASFGGQQGNQGGASYGGQYGNQGGASYGGQYGYQGGASYGGQQGYRGGCSNGGQQGNQGGCSFGGQQTQQAYQQPAQPQYQPPAQPQYQPPAQPQYQPPAQPQYQPPAQPQYQPPAQPEYQQPSQPQYQPPAQPEYENNQNSYDVSHLGQYQGADNKPFTAVFIPGRPTKFKLGTPADFGSASYTSI